MIFAWMNARVDVDIEREKKRVEKERQTARYFSVVAETEKLVSRPVSSFFRALSLSLSL